MEESEVSWETWGRLPEEPPRWSCAQSPPRALWNSVSPYIYHMWLWPGRHSLHPQLGDAFLWCPWGPLQVAVTSPRKAQEV